MRGKADYSSGTPPRLTCPCISYRIGWDMSQRAACPPALPLRKGFGLAWDAGTWLLHRAVHAIIQHTHDVKVHRLVFLMMATYGEGEPTTTATTFVQYITDMGAEAAGQKKPLQARRLPCFRIQHTSLLLMGCLLPHTELSILRSLLWEVVARN